MLCCRLRPLEDTERERVLQSLRSVAEWYRATTRRRGRLRARSSRGWRKGAFRDWRAHRVPYRALSWLPTGRQEKEVDREQGGPGGARWPALDSFSYPYGGPATSTTRRSHVGREGRAFDASVRRGPVPPRRIRCARSAAVATGAWRA